MANMYNVPTDGCNLEIMGYPFYAEEVTPNEAFRRRDYNFNNIVGGTQKVTKGAFVGLDFTIVTHVAVPQNNPKVHNKIFKQMVSKPVKVVSPEFGGSFNAVVTIKPEHVSPKSLKLTINIKEVPNKKSGIVGEKFTVPAAREIKVKKTKAKSKAKDNATSDKSKKGKKKSAAKKNKGKKK